MFYISKVSIYLIGFILFPFLFFYKSKIVNFNNQMLSKKSTSSIKGICILVIVLFHICQHVTLSNNLVTIIYSNIAGYLAVGLFFMYSGYGLTVSKNSKDNYFKNFLSKRLLKVYIPFVIINIIYITEYHGI